MPTRTSRCCGLGEAALALAEDLGDDGEVVGDACALDEPDACFDVVRSERTLQWLADPGAALAEMARVVRRGSRISLIDTDWSTFEMTSATTISPPGFVSQVVKGRKIGRVLPWRSTSRAIGQIDWPANSRRRPARV